MFQASNTLAPGGWGGLTVIIMLNSVQYGMKLDLSTGTELGNNADYFNCPQPVPGNKTD